jgi:hypothetical protein
MLCQRLGALDSRLRWNDKPVVQRVDNCVGMGHSVAPEFYSSFAGSYASFMPSGFHAT